MAEVATSVLHNVGNVLNSVNVSCAVISAAVRKSHIGTITKTAGLLQEHAENLPEFFANDPRAKKLPNLLSQLSVRLVGEQESVLRELRQLGDHIDHIKEIVSMQQNYGRVLGITERISVTDLVEDSLRINAGALLRHQVQPIRDYEEVPSITVDKHKVLQILVNLIRNAKYACDESGRGDKRMTVRVSSGQDRVCISVIDNGVGIPAENMTRIFNHGFTTRQDGHGFGLHSAVLAAQELGGNLSAHSEGPGLGAVFVLELPLEPSGRG
jgi:signal transduction histidine kinase